MPDSMTRPVHLLRRWVQRQVLPETWTWLEGRLQSVASGATRDLFLGFGLVSRKVGKADLALTSADLDDAEEARPGWNPDKWTLDQAARTLLVLSLPAPEQTEYVATLDTLFAAAEMGEAVALYQALPLLPFPAAHRFRCTEGIRTNIASIFTAIAHRNPYPAEQLDESAWNQLVLKCFFMGVALDPIVGLDRRANSALRQMLVDLAHERRAAKRPVPLELWRCVGPCADEAAVRDLAQVLVEGTPVEQSAAALALSQSSLPSAFAALSQRPDLQQEIEAGAIRWNTIGQ